MHPFRPIQPAPVVLRDINYASVEPLPREVPQGQRPQKQTRQRHTEDDWEQIRGDLAGLLHAHDLKDAARIIKDTRGFDAGLRSYRSRIAQWGLQQNYKSDVLGVVAAKVQKRKLDEEKDSVVIIEGERLETTRVELFQRRAQNMQSPSQATPQGVDYYTPYGPGLTPGSHKSPPAWSPLEIRPAFRETLPHSREQQDWHTNMMLYDRCPEAIVTVTVESQLIGGAKDDDLAKHKFHQTGMLAVIARGRFSKRDKASQLLWQACNMGMSMIAMIQNPNSVQMPPALLHHADDKQGVRFFSYAQPADFGSYISQSLVTFVKQNRLIQNVLGLTKQDLAHWSSSWTPIGPSEAPLVEAVADHLFGDTSLSYPSMDILNILVQFNTSSPRAKPILLRVSVGRDPRGEVRNCPHCCNTFQIVDYVGPDGAVKLHLSSLNPGIRQTFHDGGEFSEDNTTSQQVVYTHWSQLAYMYQGWAEARAVRRCPCNNKPVHYIDLFDEKICEKEVFDPMGESLQTSFFEPFPQESRLEVVIGDRRKRLPEEDEWNPDGDEGSEDEQVFEPFPPDDHEAVCHSRPIMRV